MNKLIEQLVKKFEFVQKINELSLNRLSSSVVSMTSTHVQSKIKQIKLKYSILDLITALLVSPHKLYQQYHHYLQDH